MKNKIKKLNFKAIIGNILLLSFIILAFTGIILFIAPDGKTARWIFWKFFGLTKYNWEDIHVVFSWFFLFIAIIHIFINNFKNILNYIRKRIKEKIHIKKEFLISLIITFFITLGTIYNIFPLKYIIKSGSYFSSLWEKTAQKPPATPSEDLNLIQVAELIPKYDLNNIKKILNDANISYETKYQALREIAKKKQYISF